MMFQSTSIF